MPIEKESISRLLKFGYHFGVVPTETVDQITNPVALAYWTYLLTRPDNWVVRRTQLMERFGVGRDRHDAAMSQLKELGLVWVQTNRDGDGKFTDRTLMVGAIPVDDLPMPKVGKPTIRENRPQGKTDHLTSDLVINKDLGNSSFGEFWENYPKKQAKAPSEKSFNRLSSKDQQLAITDLIARAKSDPDWLKENGKYIPLASTYLNQRRWEDEWRPVSKTMRKGIDYV